MRRTEGTAVAAWDEAKAASDFAAFVPHLEHQLELMHRYIDCFPPADATYDVLLEDYEEGMTTAKVTAVFDEVKRTVIPLIADVRDEHARIPTLHGVGWFDNITPPHMLDYERLVGDPETAPFQYLHAGSTDHENYRFEFVPIPESEDHDTHDDAGV